MCFSLCSRSILYTGNTRSGINSWIDIGLMLENFGYIFLMANFQILANDHVLIFLFEFEAIIFVSLVLYTGRHENSG